MKKNYASNFIEQSELSAEITKISFPIVAEFVNKHVVENKRYTKIGKIYLSDIISLLKSNISSTCSKFSKWIKFIEVTEKVIDIQNTLCQ